MLLNLKLLNAEAGIGLFCPANTTQFWGERSLKSIHKKTAQEEYATQKTNNSISLEQSVCFLTQQLVWAVHQKIVLIGSQVKCHFADRNEKVCFYFWHSISLFLKPIHKENFEELYTTVNVSSNFVTLLLFFFSYSKTCAALYFLVAFLHELHELITNRTKGPKEQIIEMLFDNTVQLTNTKYSLHK